MLKLKYLLTAFTLIGLITVWKVASLLLIPIIACILVYVVYILHSKLKRKKCSIFSTKKGEVIFERPERTNNTIKKRQGGS